MRQAEVNFTPLIDMLFIILYIVVGGQAESSTHQISKLQEQQQTVQSQRNDLMARLGSMRQALDKIQAEASLLMQERQGLTQDLKKREDEIIRLAAQKEMLLAWEQKYLELDKKLRQKEEEVARLLANKEDLAQWPQKYDALHKQLLAMQNELTMARQELEKEREAKKDLAQKLQERVQALSAQEQKFAQEKSLLQEGNKQLETGLQKIQQELQLEKANLAAQLEEKQSLKAQLVSEVQKLRNQIEGLFQNKGKMEKEIESLQKEIDKYQKQLNKLEEDTHTLKQQLEDKVRQYLQKELAYQEVQERLQEDAKRKQQLEQAVLQQETLHQLLKKQYAQMWDNFQGRNLHKTYMKSQILTANFAIYEVSLHRDKMSIRTSSDQEFPMEINKTTTQKHVAELFEMALPMAVRYDANRAIFLVLIEPDSLSLHKEWIERELKNIKVLYTIQWLP